MENIPRFGIRKGGGAGGRAAQEKLEAQQRLEARATKVLAAEAANQAPASGRAARGDMDDSTPTAASQTFLTGTKPQHSQPRRLDSMPAVDIDAKAVDNTLRDQKNRILEEALERLSSIMDRRQGEFDEARESCKQDHARDMIELSVAAKRIDALERGMLVAQESLKSDLDEMSKQLTLALPSSHAAIADTCAGEALVSFQTQPEFVK